jgi:antitoxin component YwqK of YwqJK toxin-antitoxin module
MLAKKTGRDTERVEHHKDGTVRARGLMRDGELHGYWEWFRKDGSIMRTGSFDRGRRVGEWTTWSRDGRVVKVTQY